MACDHLHEERTGIESQFIARLLALLVPGALRRSRHDETTRASIPRAHARHAGAEASPNPEADREIAALERVVGGGAAGFTCASGSGWNFPPVYVAG